eukprot:TRINITY_DN108212_c0_g1_i1.p1 TRINITY_DN108212_c0_g1~~TRINITY_DN108212_c0_g1_i1.p1  ORF type:complete len:1053 (-),score=116.33 TRINITY_DN108212_c0_g1_i1:58-3174(-)
MATVIFAHFGASAVALALRYQSRPVLRCLARCRSSISSCCRCLCSCCCRATTARGDVEHTQRGSYSRYPDGGLKWYWFHMAMQVGFAVREFLLISSLQGWRWETAFVHFATWFTIFVVAREVWRFSQVRTGPEKQKIAVDGLLDMLLLPVNIVFFCAVCVRVLVLQSESHIRSMVSVVMESGDIYESFALWSVLVLFVKVVEAELAERDTEAMSSFRSFKSISLQGVKAWVFMQSAAVVGKLVLDGLVAVYVPTFCFWASQSCQSCEEWFENNIATALSAVNFILCSFAIMFVFYFEAGYRHQLEKIGPMWKFLGVKGIVSVTYFQWLVISLLASPLAWDNTRVYLIHCILYAFWMPLLAIMHTSLAYPFYSLRQHAHQRSLAPWLEAWLRTIAVGDESAESLAACVEDPSRREGEAGGTDRDTPSSTPRTEVLLEQHEGRTDRQLEGDDVQVSDARTTHEAKPSCGHRFAYALCGLLSCFASIRSILWLVPPDDSRLEMPLRNISCTSQGDIAHFLQTTRSDLHFAMLNDTMAKWSTRGVAGSWLPLCASTMVGCQAGHYAAKELPSIACTARGEYSWQGSCSAISCGTPPHLPHAQPRMHDIERQNWTYGVTINYDCDKPGFHGHLKAVCNVTGIWSVHGACVEVTCGPPPQDVPHAKPVVAPGKGDENVSTGMVVRYQCDDMYVGTPTATCGDDGLYVTAGRCKRECGPPPAVPHAAPSFDNKNVSHGWYEGTRCPYSCNPGYVGFATALCGADGNFTVAGLCKPISCGSPPHLPVARARMDDVTKQNFSFGSVIRFDCNKPAFKGTLQAECNVTGTWIIQGTCQEVTCSKPPEDIPHATPLIHPSAAGQNVTAGTVIRYQCDSTYNGTPTATCGYDSMYVTQGNCRKACLPLPQVPHASPSFDSKLAAHGWYEGMGTRYSCDPGYEGDVTALCGQDGNFSVEGFCKVASSIEKNRLYQRIHGLTAAIGVENVLLFAVVGLGCWYRGRISARTVALPEPTSSAGHELATGLTSPLSPRRISGTEYPSQGGVDELT